MNQFKLKTKSAIGISTVSVYAVPSATTTTVIGITLTNISGSSINVGIGITRASQENVKILKDVPIPQGSTLEVMQGNKIILETTDTLTAVSDTNGSLDVALSILEMS